MHKKINTFLLFFNQIYYLCSLESKPTDLPPLSRGCIERSEFFQIL